MEYILNRDEIEQALKDYLKEKIGIDLKFENWVDYSEPQGIIFSD